MLDHISLQCDDVTASRQFFEQLLRPLQISVLMERGDVVGFAGPDGFPRLWLGPSQGGTQREVHLAFTAPDRAAVDAVHQAAVELGTEILHEPRIWPEYHDTYYGVFVRDLDGNNIEAVCHR